MIMKKNRTRTGNTIAEFGPALYVIFCVITFPLLAFGSAGVRYALLANAANLAAQQASKARTFNTDIPAAAGSPAHLSAVHTAQNVASLACSQIGGGAITLTQTQVFIKILPVSSATSTPPQPAANTPLSASLLNPALYTYTCEVILTGSIAPVLPLNWGGAIGVKVPLLNEPLTTTTRADYMFENNLNLSI
jgi:hypothetical protein